ncbi:alpha/beta-hydrolase [Thozetella sp. PMI_491]|nr:alpha/beta-hydrolase [Thozetella sp. PMI_491]
MAAQFGIIPENIPGKPEPFNLRVPEQDIADFRQLLKLSKIGPATWWNQHKDHRYGVSREWLSQAKEAWLSNFDWRKHEERINKFPNFKMDVKDPEAGHINMHFIALFSAKKDATPLVFLHGYPASFTEFLPVVELLTAKYTPETLPYHVIVPSLPDYGLSGSPSENIEMTVELSARIVNQLMIDLGFGEGYLAQGGDLGSLIARILSAEYKECKAFHVNMLDPTEAPPSYDGVSAEELAILKRTEAWRETGMAYALEHATRPATAGLAIASSPLALLAWIGEKLVEWVDPRAPLPLDTLLATVSLYWFTDSFPRSLYHASVLKFFMPGQRLPTSKEKPLGYSLFAHDLAVLPHAWAKQVYPNLKFFRMHAEGGHFASEEQPEAFLEDVEEFAGAVRGLFGAE